MIKYLTAAFCAIVIWSAPAPLSAEPAAGVLKSVSGDVQVFRGGASQPGEAGMDLMVGDILQTGDGSALGATLADGTTLSLGSRGRFQLAAFQFAPSRSVFDIFIDLMAGRLIYGSGKIGEEAPERVRIETPHTVVGTRGTRFAVVTPEWETGR